MDFKDLIKRLEDLERHMKEHEVFMIEIKAVIKFIRSIITPLFLFILIAIFMGDEFNILNKLQPIKDVIMSLF
jgi:hypothetical protein